MGRTETRIDRALLDVVRERAAEQGRGEEELIEEAVRRYLDDEAEGTLGELLDGVAAWQKERGVEPLSDEEAMKLANEELHAFRRGE